MISLGNGHWSHGKLARISGHMELRRSPALRSAVALIPPVMCRPAAAWHISGWDHGVMSHKSSAIGSFYWDLCSYFFMDLLDNVLINIVFGYVWKWDILPNGRFLGEKMMNQPMACPRKHSLSYLKLRGTLEPSNPGAGCSSIHWWKGPVDKWGYWYCRAVVPLRLRLQVRQRCSSLIISSCSIFLLGDVPSFPPWRLLW